MPNVHQLWCSITSRTILRTCTCNKPLPLYSSPQIWIFQTPQARKKTVYILSFGLWTLCVFCSCFDWCLCWSSQLKAITIVRGHQHHWHVLALNFPVKERKGKKKKNTTEQRARRTQEWTHFMWTTFTKQRLFFFVANDVQICLNPWRHIMTLKNVFVIWVGKDFAKIKSGNES